MRAITAGSTNQSIYYYIVQDASAISPGEPVTGLLFSDIETGGSASYMRSGAARVDLTLITLASASAVHADGGFIEVDGTNMKGWYRCDYPDAAFVTGVNMVAFAIVVASGKNAVASPVEVLLTDVDFQDSIRGGMTALPNAAADAAGGLPISNAGGLALDTKLANTNEITVARMGALTDWINGGRLDLLLDAIKVPTDKMVFTVSNQLDTNVLSISGDTLAADNLEAMYDGTGYVDDTAPASRAQVGAISTVGGGAINLAPNTDNVLGAIKGITFVGVQTTNTFTATRIADASFHVIDDTANAIDIVYGFDIGGGKIADLLNFVGFLNSANDTLNILAFDFVAVGWDTIGTLGGQGGSTNVEESIPLLVAHTGTGVDAGIVYIRFQNTGQTNPTFNNDRLLISAVANTNTIGYEGGAVWLDTAVSNINTELFVDGTADNPVSAIEAARTIADALNIKIIHALPGSSYTLAQSFDNFELIGSNWTLALGGQQITNSEIVGALVSGIATGTNPLFVNCMIGDTTLPPCSMENCGFTGTITSGSAGDYFFDQCHSSIAGVGTPVFDLGAALLNSNINYRHYSGGTEFQNIGSAGVDNVSLEGDGHWILNANCVGGTFVVRGGWEETDNSITTTITRDQNSADSRAIILDTANMQPKLGTPAADISADIAAVKVDTAQIGIAGAGLTDLGGMSTAMKAEINAEADTALVDYDAATGTELAAVDAKIDIIDTNIDQIEAAVITNAVGVDIAADIIAVKADTVEIGLAGAGLTEVILAATGLDAIVSTATGMVEQSKAVWDRLLIGATHNITNSAGKRVRDVIDSVVIFTDTAVSATINTITLPAGASSVDGAYDPAAITIVGGTGMGQSRLILEYTGSTKVAVVDRDWKATPDGTSVITITTNPGREHVNEGLAQAGTSNTVTLNVLASSVDDVYVGQIVFIRSGTGQDQAGTVIGYNGTTKVATVHKNWGVVPNTTSGYVMIPASPVELTANAIDLILDEVLSGHTTAGTLGKAILDIEAGIFDPVTTTVDIGKISGSADAATRLSLSANQIIPFTVDTATFTPTPTVFEADDIVEATPDHFNGRIIIWSTGVLAGQATSITDYELANSKGKFTVVGMTEAPANNDTGMII